MPRCAFAAILLLSACATGSPLNNISAMQQRLDQRGMGFGLTRVSGHDAVLFQVRFSTSATEGQEEAVDPMDAATAAAPPGCSVASIEPQQDGLSFKVEYDC